MERKSHVVLQEIKIDDNLKNYTNT